MAKSKLQPETYNYHDQQIDMEEFHIELINK